MGAIIRSLEKGCNLSYLRGCSYLAHTWEKGTSLAELPREKTYSAWLKAALGLPADLSGFETTNLPSKFEN